MQNILKYSEDFTNDTWENSYYTPSIDDIRVGYECEFRAGANRYKKILQKSDIEDALYKFEIEELYTAFLTKEQIEAEGWQLLKKVELNRGNVRYSDNNFLYFSKGDLLPNTEYFSKFNLRYKMDDHTIHIISKMRNVDNTFKSYIKLPTFYGKCPSINEFRTIIKLLGI